VAAIGYVDHTLEAGDSASYYIAENLLGDGHQSSIVTADIPSPSDDTTLFVAFSAIAIIVVLTAVLFMRKKK